MGEFEIAFSFDTTGSMYACLEQVRSQLQGMVQELNKKIPNMRIAIFAHGDYCDAGRTYVTKYINFTTSSTDLCNFVKNVEATGGGDIPECYELVMREVQEKLSWKENSQKALVLIGDANPHEIDYPQNVRRLDWKDETVRLRKKGIKIYAVQCNASRGSEEFYQHIAARSFGYYMQLDNFSEVKEVLMNICFREAGLESSAGMGGLSMPTGVRVFHLWSIFYSVWLYGTPTSIEQARHVKYERTLDNFTNRTTKKLRGYCMDCKSYIDDLYM